jgi:hypothetical protein
VWNRYLEVSSSLRILKKSRCSACMRIEDSSGDTLGTQVTDINMDRLVKGAILISLGSLYFMTRVAAEHTVTPRLCKFLLSSFVCMHYGQNSQQCSICWRGHYNYMLRVIRRREMSFGMWRIPNGSSSCLVEVWLKLANAAKFTCSSQCVA